MQHEPAPSTHKKFKLSKAHLLIIGAIVAAGVAAAVLVPGKSHELSDTQTVALTEAENNLNKQLGSSDYKITTASQPQQINDSPDKSVSTQSQVSPNDIVPQPDDQLSTISQQLQTIQDAISKDDAAANIKTIASQLDAVSSEIKAMITDSGSAVTSAIESAASSLSSELNGMKGQLGNIEQLSEPGGYINPSNLPFTVQFIDNVAGQNVVSVSYNALIAPLSVGDSLAGWRLIRADFASEEAVFENSKNQLVRVEINTVSAGGQ